MDGVRGGEDAKIFWRDPERRKNNGYEHSLITSGEKILDYLAKGKIPTKHGDGWNYLQAFKEDGTPAAGEPPVPRRGGDGGGRGGGACQGPFLQLQDRDL